MCSSFDSLCFCIPLFTKLQTSVITQTVINHGQDVSQRTTFLKTCIVYDKRQHISSIFMCKSGGKNVVWALSFLWYFFWFSFLFKLLENHSTHCNLRQSNVVNVQRWWFVTSLQPARQNVVREKASSKLWIQFRGASARPDVLSAHLRVVDVRQSNTQRTNIKIGSHPNWIYQIGAKQFHMGIQS